MQFEKNTSLPITTVGKPISNTSSHKFEFVNVSFTYPHTEKEVLTNISFSFYSNETIALAGINGCGKTTIIKLLLRFYEPSQGAILMDGVDISKYDLTAYRQMFSAMFQSYNNYNITIRENITLSEKNNDDGAIFELLEKFKAPSVLKNLDVEYSKTFSENGIVLSKGQAQLFNMLRVFYNESLFYIFDEPSASMDATTEETIVQNILELCTQKGALFISHRLSNLTRMDRILFLQDGKLLENGTHEQLIKSEGEYFKLFMIQKERYH